MNSTERALVTLYSSIQYELAESIRDGFDGDSAEYIRWLDSIRDLASKLGCNIQLLWEGSPREVAISASVTPVEIYQNMSKLSARIVDENTKHVQNKASLDDAVIRYNEYKCAAIRIADRLDGRAERTSTLAVDSPPKFLAEIALSLWRMSFDPFASMSRIRDLLEMLLSGWESMGGDRLDILDKNTV